MLGLQTLLLLPGMTSAVPVPASDSCLHCVVPDLQYSAVAVRCSRVVIPAVKHASSCACL
jgi:hypothetical protein